MESRESPARRTCRIRDNQHCACCQWLQGHQSIPRQKVRVAGAQHHDSKSRVGPLLQPPQSRRQQHTYAGDLSQPQQSGKVCWVSKMRQRRYVAWRMTQRKATRDGHDESNKCGRSPVGDGSSPHASSANEPAVHQRRPEKTFVRDNGDSVHSAGRPRRCESFSGFVTTYIARMPSSSASNVTTENGFPSR
jgi:hypothetical protein